MIFSRLFSTKNKWQAKDSNIRIAAINEELNVNNSDEKKILQSLLSSDTNELVRRAALIKLNDFEDYVTASQVNDNEAVQHFAVSQVNDILSNKHSINLVEEKKLKFINDEASKSFLPAWLEKEQEPSIVIALYNQRKQQHNEGHLFSQIFAQKQTENIQLKLLTIELPELSDISFLTKLLKKSSSESISAEINNLISTLVIAEEKPKKLQKSLQLTLSKLLALKDVTKFGEYKDKLNILEEQWAKDTIELSCLSNEQQVLLTEKHEKITSQLTQIFAPKEEAYQQEMIAKQLLIDKQVANDLITKNIAEINQQITTSVFEDHELDQTVFSSKLLALKNTVSTSVLNTKEQETYLSKISELSKRLTQLPEIAESVSEATHLISKISQLTIPQSLSELNDRIQTYNDWLVQWKTVERKAAGVLPVSIKDAYDEIVGLWNKGLKPLQVEQKQIFGQTRKKLNDIKRLTANGKYKVCFGLFKGVNQHLALLSTKQQQQLQRDYDEVSEKMAEISDWEHYIATPRKQELLAEIKQLVEIPLDNPNEQAEKVKYYRKTWNSLGHAEESVDKALNDQFNDACEQAFAPCRQFYLEQESLRAKNLIERNMIIEQAQQIVNVFNAEVENDKTDKANSIWFKNLDGQINKIQQSWNKTGEVDRSEYQRLQKLFRDTISPIKNAIKSFHDTNNVNKQSLIKKAQQQLLNEDIFQAIENVKQLQKEWRDIGFAGSRQENILWRDFRKVNDALFAKRDEAKSLQDNAQAELAEQYNVRLTKIKDAFSALNDKPQLNKIKQDTEILLEDVVSHKPVIKAVANDIELFLKVIQQSVTEIDKQTKITNWVNLFSLLKAIATQESSSCNDSISNDENYDKLTSFWQKRLQEQLSSSVMADQQIRDNKTLAIEILAQVDSPQELAQQRMAVQVELMQEQMLSGTEINLTSQLVEWLQLGKLTPKDVELLDRLQVVYIKQ